MVSCSFCGGVVVVGTGMTSFKKDGTPTSYCSSKCENNAKLGRNPKKFKWARKPKETPAGQKK